MTHEINTYNEVSVVKDVTGEEHGVFFKYDAVENPDGWHIENVRWTLIAQESRRAKIENLEQQLHDSLRAAVEARLTGWITYEKIN